MRTYTPLIVQVSYDGSTKRLGSFLNYDRRFSITPKLDFRVWLVETEKAGTTCINARTSGPFCYYIEEMNLLVAVDD